MPRGDGFLGVPPFIIVCNLTPDDDGLVRKVLQDDNLAPFSSDKIRAKSARILSVAITCMTLPSAGVRIEHPQGLGYHVTLTTSIS